MKNTKKIKKLVTELKAVQKQYKKNLAFVTEIQKAKLPNDQLVHVILNANNGILVQMKAYMSLINRFTGKSIKVVAVSDTHTNGWGVEMTLADKNMELKTFRYVTVFDVKADHQANKVANAAQWKYFWAEDVKDHWTQI